MESSFLQINCADGSEQAIEEAPNIYNPPFMNFGLQDRVAIVAASSQGIGRATAEAFAAEGFKVAMCARNEQTLQAAAHAISKLHKAEIFARALDVGDATGVSQFVAEVAA